MATKKQSPRTENTFKLDGREILTVAEQEALKQASDNHRLAGQVAHLKRQNHILGQALLHARKPPRFIPTSPAKPTTRKGESLRVIIPDSHGSAISKPAAAAFLADLKRLDPTEIVMLGDHVDCGGFLAQHHVLGYVAQTDYSYTDDIAATNQFLDQIQKAAPRAIIHYIEGNHERRVETWCVTQTLRHEKDCRLLRAAFVPEYLLRLKDRGIRYYRQSENYINGVPGTIKLGKCYFWHGTSTARDAASVNLSQIGGNVVYGHTHREAHARRRPVSTGDIGAWCPGCLCDNQPLWQHTRPTDWTHGYGVQSVMPSGNFLHINIPIVQGVSLLAPMLDHF